MDSINMDDINGELVLQTDENGVMEYGRSAIQDAELLISFAIGEASNEVITNANNEPENESDLTQNLNLDNEENIPQKKDKEKKIKIIRKIIFLQEENHNKRMRGESYQGFQKIDGKVVRVPRSKKRPGDKCKAKTCIKCQGVCTVMAMEHREELCDDFWKLTTKEKSIYLKSNIDENKPKASYGDPILSKPHSVRRSYFLRYNGLRSRVCLNFFLTTLCISESYMKKLLDYNATLEGNTVPPIVLPPNCDKPIRPTKQQFEESKSFIIKQLNMLPKVESHFCRSSSNKLYLQSDFRSKHGVHE
jgi:hypothetical protein